MFNTKNRVVFALLAIFHAFALLAGPAQASASRSEDRTPSR